MSVLRVIVGMSGGVDSAVAAWLLKEQGHQVQGLFMTNWTEDEAAYCSAAEDFKSARQVCDELDIPLHKVDFSAEYRERVFARLVADYQAGRTPNPDLLCNREVKFLPFVEHAQRLGADFVATGHYAALQHDDAGAHLLRSPSDDKDQTYFLALVPRERFAKVMFPLGQLSKPEVRELARQAGLPNHRRKDSTGVCFIGERPFGEFISRYLEAEPGPIIDDCGRQIGRHQGLLHYTLGQRKGIAIGGVRGASEAPWYVIGKDLQHNCLQVSQQPQHPRLMSHRLHTREFSWIQRPRDEAQPLQARIRHRQPLQDCRIGFNDDGGIEVQFAEPQRAAAPGQYCVIYAGQECLGGGEIDRVETLSSC